MIQLGYKMEDKFKRKNELVFQRLNEQEREQLACLLLSAKEVGVGLAKDFLEERGFSRGSINGLVAWED